MKKYFFLLLAAVLSFSFVACSDEDNNDDNQHVICPTSPITILNNGKEVKPNEVVQYMAQPDIFGNPVAGADFDPLFKLAEPSKVEVIITIPENQLAYIQWCGITKQCLDIHEQGVYQRVNNAMTDDAMEMHAHFKPEVYTTCKVQVDVKVNDVVQQTFFIEYIYSQPEK